MRSHQRRAPVTKKQDDGQLSSKVVVIGGGMWAGYFAQALVEATAQDRCLCTIVSADALPPYDETVLADDFLSLFDESGACTLREIPLTQPESWYQRHGVRLLTDMTVTSTNDSVVVAQSSNGDIVRIKYENLVMADESCIRESGVLTVDGVLKPDQPQGFGSVHTWRHRVAEAAKLACAVRAREKDGQEACSDPVIIMGDGLEALSLAGRIATSRKEKLAVTLILESDRLLPELFSCSGGQEVTDFYERHLSRRAGIKFARNFKFKRYWSLDEVGEFPTLHGRALSLQRTRPRPFGRGDPCNSQVRGVVLEGIDGDVWVPARFVVHCPNAKKFQDVQVSARQAAHKLVGKTDSTTPEQPYSLRGSVLDLSFEAKFSSECCNGTKFAGVVATLGLDTFAQTKTFGAFWTSDNCIVGTWLEGANAEDRRAGEIIASQRPPFTRLQRFKKLQLKQLLDNPHILKPPALERGDFLAETDIECITESFAEYDCGDKRITLDGAAKLMRDLGADWAHHEEQIALRSLDPRGTGFVDLATFIAWWLGPEKSPELNEPVRPRKIFTHSEVDCTIDPERMYYQSILDELDSDGDEFRVDGGSSEKGN